MALFYYKEKKNKGIRAAAYLRLSIEDGDKAESNSIGNQRELIQNFVAERPELHLVGEYADDGYTGTNFERPGFTQMMEDIQSDKINCIIVKDLSRLGRNYIEMGKYLERIFPMMGIRFIAINDNYDNANTESSDSDSIVVPFKNLLNDSYCRDISIKVRSQLDIKRRNSFAVYRYMKAIWPMKLRKNSIMLKFWTMDILSAGQCAVRNGSAFIPDEAVAGDGSTSNADRRICDFYDSAGGWQRGCVFGTGGSNDSASMVHIRKGET